MALPYVTIAVNLGTGRGASVRQVVDKVQHITGREIIARDASRRVGDPPALVADAKKAVEVLDWKPRRSELAAGSVSDLLRANA